MNKREGLTERQQEVLTLKAMGLTSGEVAEKLGITLDTVKTHCNTILRRLGAHNMVQAIAIYERKMLTCEVCRERPSAHILVISFEADSSYVRSRPAITIRVCRVCGTRLAEKTGGTLK